MRELEFSQEIADLVCERIADGESLRSICKDVTMPASSTIFKWLNKVPAFAEQYARARETQADTLVDEMLDIVDDSANDYMERDGRTVVNAEAIQRSKLRFEARQWLAGKMRPKKYGPDKLVAEISGKDGAPIETKTTHDIATAAAFVLRKGLEAK